MGVMVDWRSMPDELGRYEVVLASDVLYERPYGALVAGAIAAVLAPNGVALIADPGRVGRESFLSALTAHGLGVRSKNDIAYVNSEIRQTIACFEEAGRVTGGLQDRPVNTCVYRMDVHVSAIATLGATRYYRASAGCGGRLFGSGSEAGGIRGQSE